MSRCWKFMLVVLVFVVWIMLLDRPLEAGKKFRPRPDPDCPGCAMCRPKAVYKNRGGAGVPKKYVDPTQVLLSEARRLYAYGVRNMRRGKYAEAICSFLRIKDLPVNTDYKGRADARLAEIAKIGQERLSQVDKDIEEKDYLSAVRSLREINKEFSKIAIGSKAKEKLNILLQNPEVVKLLREMEANEVYTQAEDRKGRKLYYQALLLYEKAADTYGDTESGQKAEKLLAEWKADPEFMALVRKQEATAQCKGWFSLAESYSKHGVNEKALEFYQKIIDAYPDTLYAKQASKKIASLQVD